MTEPAIQPPAEEVIQKVKPKRKYVYTKKTGRPSPFPLLKIENIKKLISKGFNDTEIAEFIGVTSVTYYGWKSKHKSFFSEIEVFKKTQNANIRRSLYERAFGYSHEAIKFLVVKGKVVREKYIEHYPPDTEACKFWLKNKESEDWRDEHEVKHSGEIKFINHIPEPEIVRDAISAN